MVHSYVAVSETPAHHLPSPSGETFPPKGWGGAQELASMVGFAYLATFEMKEDGSREVLSQSAMVNSESVSLGPYLGDVFAKVWCDKPTGWYRAWVVGYLEFTTQWLAERKEGEYLPKKTTIHIESQTVTPIN